MLESRVLMAVTPTHVIGAGTFGPPTHNFTISTITSPSVVQGSSNVDGNVINVAANATSAQLVVSGFVMQSGGTNPPASHVVFSLAVIDDATDDDLTTVTPDPDNATFTWNFSVPAGQTALRYEARKNGTLQIQGLTGTVGVNRIPSVNVNTGVSIAEGATTTLNNNRLRVDDADGDTVTYTLTSTGAPQSGTLKKSGTPLAAGGTFTQADISSGAITYEDGASNAATDRIIFTASDGNATLAPTTFTFTVGSSNAAPTIATNAGITLNEGASATIGGNKLAAADTDNSTAQLTFSVTGLPSHGTLSKSGTALGAGDTFTQADLNSNLVVYTHDGSESTSDDFDFQVSDPAGAAIAGTFAITVTPVNDAPTLAVNEPLQLFKGATATIERTILRTADPDNPPEEIVYTIGDITDTGTLKRDGVALAVNGTFTQKDLDDGLIAYTQGNNDSTSDTFMFTVRSGAGGGNDGGNGGGGGGGGGGAAPIGPFTFEITTLPNVPPRVATNLGLFLVKGTSTTVSSSRLRISDTNDAAAELTITLTAAPTGGTLLKNGTALAAGDTFTQADVNANMITYQHGNGDGAADSFKFTVIDDNGGTLAETTTAINILAQDPAVGGTLYATAKGVGGVGFLPSKLYTVNPLTGAFTLVGDIKTADGMAFNNVSGLAFLNDGRMVGSCVGDGLFPGISPTTFAAALIQIDPATGIASLIGKIDDKETGVSGRVPDLAYDSATNTLYGFGNTNPSSGFLYEINQTTGVGTLLGNAGFSEKGNSIEIDPATGTLLGTGSFNPESLLPDADPPLLPGELNLHRSLTVVNRDNGQRTPITGTIGNVPDQIDGLDFNSVTHVLYGIEDARIGPTPAPVRTYFLDVIDQTTGIGTRIGPAMTGAAALAWSRPAVAAPRAEIRIEGAGKPIATGDATPSALDDTDFGVVNKRQKKITKTFTIKNTGLAPLNLSGDVQVMGTNTRDFKVLTQPATTVAPGDSTTFDVQFAKKGKGVRTATLRVASDDIDEANYDFTVRATDTMLAVTRNDQPVSPDFPINIGTVPLGSEQIIPLTVTNTGDRAVQLASVTSPTPDAQGRGWQFVNPPVGTIQAGKSVQLLIQYFTNVPGDFGASGALIPEGGESIQVPLTGEVQPLADTFEDDDTAATAKTIATDGTVALHTLETLSGTTGGRGFDDPGLATAADIDFATFTLTSRTAVAIRAAADPITDADLRSDDLEVTLFGPTDPTVQIATDSSTGSDTSADIARVDTDALDPGTYFIRVREPGGDQVVGNYALSVRTLATEKELSVTRGGSAATGVDFGSNVQVGATSDPVALLISNDGATPLSVTGLTLGGANAGDFIVTVRDQTGAEASGGGFTVPAGSSFSANVSFKPTASGGRAATLSFNTDDADEPAVSLALTGTAQSQGLTISNVSVTGVSNPLIGGDRRAKATALVTLQNQSDADINGPVTIEIFGSTDDTLSIGTDLSLGRLSKTLKIKAGATSKPVKIKLVIPAVPATADYSVIASAIGTGVQGTATAVSATKVTIQQPLATA